MTAFDCASGISAATTSIGSNTGGTVFFSEKNTAPPMPQASVGTNNCDTGCTEVARNAARIGPKMNTISSMAASSAYAVLSSDSCCEPRSAYAQRVRTRAPNENWVSPMHMASANSTGMGTRASAASANASIATICTPSATGPTRRCPNRSNRRA